MEYLEMKNIGRWPTQEPEMGFSIVELLVALVIISIMSAAVTFYLSSTQKLYEADDEALSIVDVLQEARQRSLTQREPMRVQIDLTDNIVRLIDENDPGDNTDDALIRSVVLKDPSAVRVDTRPGDISENPPEPFPVPSLQFDVSQYVMSQAHNVAEIRFLVNGEIVQTNDVAGAGVTLHVWSPNADDANKHLIARAITIIGSKGSIRLWEYNSGLEGNNKWQDSRRTGVYGGQQTGTPTPTP